MMYTMPKNLLSICVNFALATQRVQIHRNVDIRMSHDILQAFRVNMFFKPNFRYRGLITSKL